MTERLDRLRLQLVATEMSRRVGRNVRRLREEAGLETQRELADLLPPAVTNQHVSNWERGVNQPSARYLEQLAQVLNADLSDFYADEAEENGDHAKETPDPFAGQPVDPTEQLNRIEQALTERTDHDEKMAALIEQQNQLLERQSDILTRIETLVLALPTDEQTEELLRAARGEDQPDPQSTHAPGQSERGNRVRRGAGG